MSSKYWVLFAKSAIAVWVLALLLKKLDPRAILQAIQSPQRPWALVAAIVLLLPNLWVQWIRWHGLLNQTGIATHWKDSWKSLLGGMPLGFITPGRVGEAGRSLFLNHASRWDLVSMVLIDKLYAFGPILVGGGWAMVLVISHRLGYNLFLTVPLAAMGLLLTVLVWMVAVHPDWIRSALYQIGLLFPSRDRIKTVVNAVGRLSVNSARRLTWYSILFYLIYIGQFVLLVMAFEPMHWGKAAAAAMATMLTKTLLPVSMADLGVREGASVYFFGYFGAASVSAFNAALLLFSLNVLLPAIWGLFYLPQMGRKPSGHKPHPESPSDRD